MNIQQIGSINQPQINESLCLFQKNNQKKSKTIWLSVWNSIMSEIIGKKRCVLWVSLSLSVSQQVEVSLMEVVETGLAWLTHEAPVEGN